MDNLREIVLGEEAFNYVQRNLSYGLTLSKYVLKKIDLYAGQIFTGLPGYANFEKVDDFEKVGILPTTPKPAWEIIERDGKKPIIVPVPVAYSYVIGTIYSFLRISKDRICLFENRNAKPSDPSLCNYKSSIYFFENEVYHALTNRSCPVKQIEQTIRESHSIGTLVGFMTSLPQVNQDLTQIKLSNELLLVLAERVVKIVVGAYGGEGFLIWHKAEVV